MKGCLPLVEDHQKLTLGQKLLPRRDLDVEQELLLQTQDQHRLEVHSGAPRIPQSPAQLQVWRDHKTIVISVSWAIFVCLFSLTKGLKVCYKIQ